MGWPLGEPRIPRPVTLPELALADIDSKDLETEAKEVAERIATTRIVRRGRDCWENLGRANSFDSWAKIGAALAIGRDYSLRISGANRPAGQTYCRAMNQWCAEYGFASMVNNLRSHALEMHSHIDEIRSWRDGLPPRQRQRLNDPLAVTRRWKAATQANGKSAQDLRRDALAGWRRFVSCAQALPADQSRLLWQAVSAEAAAALART
jgi:hypothetical protein